MHIFPNNSIYVVSDENIIEYDWIVSPLWEKQWTPITSVVYTLPAQWSNLNFKKLPHGQYAEKSTIQLAGTVFSIHRCIDKQ